MSVAVRLAATKLYRLSFSRPLIRTMSTERWRIETVTIGNSPGR